ICCALALEKPNSSIIAKTPDSLYIFIIKLEVECVKPMNKLNTKSKDTKICIESVPKGKILRCTL
ncbi:MAG: hypothetical protein Q4B21_08155, partial [Bacteroidia bacterium]|nr:hypothetical protein [Bacteroidia bacterium]